MSTQKLILRIVIIFAALLYYAATVCYIAGDRQRKKALIAAKKTAVRNKKKRKEADAEPESDILRFKDYNTLELAGLVMHGGGILFNFVVMLSNWIINGYVPFVSMYQVLIFVSLMFALTYMYIRYVKRMDWTIPYFSLCAAVFMTGAAIMNNTLVWHYPPALQSLFFLPHVMSYMLSYSLCAVAFLLTLKMFITKDEAGKAGTEKAVYNVTITAFPFMVLGCLLGALWANECWGNYWSWDAKETWSLITIFLYALYFHLRRLKPSKARNVIINVVLVAAFAALLITFVGVNMFPNGGEHSYT